MSSPASQLVPIVTLPQGIASTGALNQNNALLNVFRVSASVTVSSISWGNGATINGNIDVGIYSRSGTTWTRLASNGGSAQAGASVVQTLALSAAVTLVPGVDYALALASDSATATICRGSYSAPSGSIGICLSKATSYPLPASIASPGGSTLWPILWAA